MSDVARGPVRRRPGTLTLYGIQTTTDGLHTRLTSVEIILRGDNGNVIGLGEQMRGLLKIKKAVYWAAGIIFIALVGAFFTARQEREKSVQAMLQQQQVLLQQLQDVQRQVQQLKVSTGQHPFP